MEPISRDTAQWAEDLQQELIRKATPAERLKLALESCPRNSVTEFEQDFVHDRGAEQKPYQVPIHRDCENCHPQNRTT